MQRFLQDLEEKTSKQLTDARKAADDSEARREERRKEKEENQRRKEVEKVERDERYGVIRAHAKQELQVI